MLSMYSGIAKQYVSSTNLFRSFTLSFKFDKTDESNVLEHSIKIEHE